MPTNNPQASTNLCVFDKDKQQRLMAWITKAGKKIDLYSAVSDCNQIRMLSKHKTPQGKYARITFFDMQPNSFEWKLEWSNDAKSSWLEVHRIHCKRVKGQYLLKSLIWAAHLVILDNYIY
jgi:hypothetical protein